MDTDTQSLNVRGAIDRRDSSDAPEFLERIYDRAIIDTTIDCREYVEHYKGKDIGLIVI